MFKHVPFPGTNKIFKLDWANYAEAAHSNVSDISSSNWDEITQNQLSQKGNSNADLHLAALSAYADITGAGKSEKLQD